MLYELTDKIRLYHGDCMEFMAGCKEKEYDLAIVDPPYGIKDDGRKHEGRIFKKDGSRIINYDPRNGRLIKIKKQLYKLNANYDENQPDNSYFNTLFLISNKHIIWGENYLRFNQKDMSSGRIYWRKLYGNADQSDCEIAWTNCINSVREFTFMWAGFRQGKSIKEGYLNQGNKKLCENRIHPNHKPVALYKWLLTNYAKPGDRILDTHGGSMSIGISAYDLGFDITICEKDDDYFFAAKERLETHIAKYAPASEILTTKDGQVKLF